MTEPAPLRASRPQTWRLFSRYRSRILHLVTEMLTPVGPMSRALDFGSGDGWFADSLRRTGIVKEVTAVDVVRRADTIVEPILYEGTHLPFEDSSFDLVYAIDAVHHSADPVAALREIVRCSRRYILLKDHTYRSSAEWLALAVLDEIGNRRFGIPSPGSYQRGWDWCPVVEDEGFERIGLICPAPCHAGPLGWATNRSQFITLWRLKAAAV